MKINQTGRNKMLGGCLISLVLIASASWLPATGRVLQKRAAFYIANETMCIVDGEVYRNGDPVPTDDHCERCTCRPPGFSCVLRDCDTKPGCKALRREGECCPEYVCGCVHNHRVYEDGEVIRDLQNACYTCRCHGSSISCTFADCLFRGDCHPEYIPGECCPRYDHCPPLSTTTLPTTLSITSSPIIQQEEIAFMNLTTQHLEKFTREGSTVTIEKIVPSTVMMTTPAENSDTETVTFTVDFTLSDEKLSSILDYETSVLTTLIPPQSVSFTETTRHRTPTTDSGRLTTLVDMVTNIPDEEKSTIRDVVYNEPQSTGSDYISTTTEPKTTEASDTSQSAENTFAVTDISILETQTEIPSSIHESTKIDKFEYISSTEPDRYYSTSLASEDVLIDQSTQDTSQSIATTAIQDSETITVIDTIELTDSPLKETSKDKFSPSHEIGSEIELISNDTSTYSTDASELPSHSTELTFSSEITNTPSTGLDISEEIQKHSETEISLTNITQPYDYTFSENEISSSTFDSSTGTISETSTTSIDKFYSEDSTTRDHKSTLSPGDIIADTWDNFTEIVKINEISVSDSTKTEILHDTTTEYATFSPQFTAQSTMSTSEQVDNAITDVTKVTEFLHETLKTDVYKPTAFDYTDKTTILEDVELNLLETVNETSELPRTDITEKPSTNNDTERYSDEKSQTTIKTDFSDAENTFETTIYSSSGKTTSPDETTRKSTYDETVSTEFSTKLSTFTQKNYDTDLTAVTEELQEAENLEDEISLNAKTPFKIPTSSPHSVDETSSVEHSTTMSLSTNYDNLHKKVATESDKELSKITSPNEETTFYGKTLVTTIPSIEYSATNFNLKNKGISTTFENKIENSESTVTYTSVTEHERMEEKATTNQYNYNQESTTIVSKEFELTSYKQEDSPEDENNQISTLQSTELSIEISQNNTEEIKFESFNQTTEITPSGTNQTLFSFEGPLYNTSDSTNAYTETYTSQTVKNTNSEDYNLLDISETESHQEVQSEKSASTTETNHETDLDVGEDKLNLKQFSTAFQPINESLNFDKDYTEKADTKETLLTEDTENFTEIQLASTENENVTFHSEENNTKFQSTVSVSYTESSTVTEDYTTANVPLFTKFVNLENTETKETTAKTDLTEDILLSKSTTTKLYKHTTDLEYNQGNPDIFTTSKVEPDSDNNMKNSNSQHSSSDQTTSKGFFLKENNASKVNYDDEDDEILILEAESLSEHNGFESTKHYEINDTTIYEEPLSTKQTEENSEPGIQTTLMFTSSKTPIYDTTMLNNNATTTPENELGHTIKVNILFGQDTFKDKFMTGTSITTNDQFDSELHLKTISSTTTYESDSTNLSNTQSQTSTTENLNAETFATTYKENDKFDQSENFTTETIAFTTKSETTDTTNDELIKLQSTNLSSQSDTRIYSSKDNLAENGTTLKESLGILKQAESTFITTDKHITSTEVNTNRETGSYELNTEPANDENISTLGPLTSTEANNDSLTQSGGSIRNKLYEAYGYLGGVFITGNSKYSPNQTKNLTTEVNISETNNVQYNSLGNDNVNSVTDINTTFGTDDSIELDSEIENKDDSDLENVDLHEMTTHKQNHNSRNDIFDFEGKLQNYSAQTDEEIYTSTPKELYEVSDSDNITKTTQNLLSNDNLSTKINDNTNIDDEKQFQSKIASTEISQSNPKERATTLTAISLLTDKPLDSENNLSDIQNFAIVDSVDATDKNSEVDEVTSMSLSSSLPLRARSDEGKTLRHDIEYLDEPLKPLNSKIYSTTLSAHFQVNSNKENNSSNDAKQNINLNKSDLIPGLDIILPPDSVKFPSERSFDDKANVRGIPFESRQKYSSVASVSGSRTVPGERSLQPYPYFDVVSNVFKAPGYDSEVHAQHLSGQSRYPNNKKSTVRVKRNSFRKETNLIFGNNLGRNSQHRDSSNDVKNVEVHPPTPKPQISKITSSFIIVNNPDEDPKLPDDNTHALKTTESSVSQTSTSKDSELSRSSTNLHIRSGFR